MRCTTSIIFAVYLWTQHQCTHGVPPPYTSDELAEVKDIVYGQDVWTPTLWPYAKVAYKVYNNIGGELKQRLDQAFAVFHQTTCVRFVRRTTEQDYLLIRRRPWCHSHGTGKRSGEQKVDIGLNCGTVGGLLYLLMHELGFFHETQRMDRDQYVTVLPKNILGDWAYYFVKEENRDVGPYDFDSIMHPGKFAWSRNGRPTILAAQPIGQNKTLSASDIRRVNRFYGCPTATSSPIPSTSTETPQGGCTDHYHFCPELATQAKCEHIMVECCKSCT